MAENNNNEIVSRLTAESSIKHIFYQYYDTIKYYLMTQYYCDSFQDTTWNHLEQYVYDKTIKTKTDDDGIEKESIDLYLLQNYYRYYDTNKDILRRDYEIKYKPKLDELFYYNQIIFDKNDATIVDFVSKYYKTNVEGLDLHSDNYVFSDFYSNDSLRMIYYDYLESLESNELLKPTLNVEIITDIESITDTDTNTIYLIEQNDNSYAGYYYYDGHLEQIGSIDSNIPYINGIKAETLSLNLNDQIDDLSRKITEYCSKYDLIKNSLTNVFKEQRVIQSLDAYPLIYHDLNWKSTYNTIDGKSKDIYAYLGYNNNSIELERTFDNNSYDIKAYSLSDPYKDLTNGEKEYVTVISDRTINFNVGPSLTFDVPNYTLTYFSSMTNPSLEIDFDKSRHSLTRRLYQNIDFSTSYQDNEYDISENICSYDQALGILSIFPVNSVEVDTNDTFNLVKLDNESSLLSIDTNLVKDVEIDTIVQKGNHTLTVTDKLGLSKTYNIPNPNYTKINGYYIDFIEDNQIGLFMSFEDKDISGQTLAYDDYLIGQLPDIQIIDPISFQVIDNVFILKHNNGLTSICTNEYYDYASYSLDKTDDLHYVLTQTITSNNVSNSDTFNIEYTAPKLLTGYYQDNNDIVFEYNDNTSNRYTLCNIETNYVYTKQNDYLVSKAEYYSTDSFYFNDYHASLISIDNEADEKQIDFNPDIASANEEDTITFSDNLRLINPDLYNTLSITDYNGMSYPIQSFEYFDNIYITSIDRDISNELIIISYSDGSKTEYKNLVNKSLIQELYYTIDYSYDNNILTEALKKTNIDLSKQYDFMPYRKYVDNIIVEQSILKLGNQSISENNFTFKVNEQIIGSVYIQQDELCKEQTFESKESLKYEDYNDLTQNKISNHTFLMCDNLNNEILYEKTKDNESYSLIAGNGIYIAYDEFLQDTNLGLRNYVNIDQNDEQILNFDHRYVFKFNGLSVMLPTVDNTNAGTELISYIIDENHLQNDTLEYQLKTKNQDIDHCFLYINNLVTDKVYNLTFSADKPYQDFEYNQSINGEINNSTLDIIDETKATYDENNYELSISGSYMDDTNLVIDRQLYYSKNKSLIELHNSFGFLILHNKYEYQDDNIDSGLINDYTIEQTELNKYVISFIPNSPNIAFHTIARSCTDSEVTITFLGFSLMETKKSKMEEGLYMSL